MKVRCICKTHNLTKDKIYNVIYYDNNGINVLNDFGFLNWVSMDIFEIVEESKVDLLKRENI